MRELKYKVGDSVRIKSIDWYNENKDETDDIECSNNIWFYREMSKFCGKVMTISHVRTDHYTMVEDLVGYWTDEMIEGLVNEVTKPKFEVGDKVKWFNHTCNITSIDTNENTYTYLIKHDDYREDKIFAKWVPESELTFDDDEETKPLTYDETVEIIEAMQDIGDSWECPQGYQFVDENGNIINASKIVLKKKKPKYPQTYEECAEIIVEYTGSDCNPKGCMGYKSTLLTSFQKLLICRDAYWKIAGEEMGLSKDLSWVPDWLCLDPLYVILYQYHDIYKAEVNGGTSCILAFPTEEMRDIFCEAFKEYIEKCKELL